MPLGDDEMDELIGRKFPEEVDDLFEVETGERSRVDRENLVSDADSTVPKGRKGRKMFGLKRFDLKIEEVWLQFVFECLNRFHQLNEKGSIKLKKDPQ